ncbi:MAG: hypothetical protein KDD26_11190 [Winogradskyella sp.]|nr:hypothetical protein [Winogradskyella sp.]
MISFKTLALRFLFILLFFSFNSIRAQELSEILDYYSNYTEAPRELVYAHLNKSTYIEGEMLGFTAYVFDKSDKKLSMMTKNLYCTISDENGTIIKQKLLRVENGVASNIFEIDSTLNSGLFTFKAYTNWMRNFKENNHFEQTFKVIDADNSRNIKPVKVEDLEIDLQILGEGGHIVYDIPNIVGIIAKNQYGLGIKNARGSIVDESGLVISEFQLNEVGIAKVVFTPKPGIEYHSQINIGDISIKKDIEGIKPSGINMSVNNLGQNVIVKLEANNLFLKQNNNSNFKIALHNGNEIQITDFVLEEDGKILFSYPKANLFSGMNILTVFNDTNRPILERLFFNTSGIRFASIRDIESKRRNDSIDIKLSLNGIDASTFHNISVSILPEDTKSYGHPNNILSQIYIQPYVTGYIEKGESYFKNTRKSNYDLDLLLLTQGWSSYNWNEIFNYDNNVFIHPFERGIDAVVNLNGKKPGTYVVYPLENSSSQIFTLKDDDTEFTVKTLFPNEDDLFRIGYIDTRNVGFNKKPSVYPQFYPSKFSEYAWSYKSLSQVLTSEIEVNNLISFGKAWEKEEQLNEVLITTTKQYSRAEKLKDKAINSRVDIIGENIKSRNLRLDLYLQRLGFVTQYDYFSGTLSITNPRVNWGTNVPLVYLDNTLLTTSSTSDFGLLSFLTMGDVDYIEYELYGIGGGIRGQAGFIKIYTSRTYKSSNKNDNVNTYDVPLRFSKNKNFYVSKYSYYNTSFYNEYGTIDWKPKLNINEKGELNLKVFNTNNNFKLFFEGTTSDGILLSQEILVDINN